MRKIFLILMLLPILAACTKAEHYQTPFETGGRTYRIALFPWKASTMSFDFKYRWTMTQALRDACRQSGAFAIAWSAYPVNGGDVKILENIDSSKIWKRMEYNKFEPDVDKVRAYASGTDADLALLYIVSADNAAASDDSSMSSKDDYIRIFLVDLSTGAVTMDYIRTNFLRKQSFGDIKRVTLRAFEKWLSEK